MENLKKDICEKVLTSILETTEEHHQAIDKLWESQKATLTTKLTQVTSFKQ